MEVDKPKVAIDELQFKGRSCVYWREQRTDRGGGLNYVDLG